MTLTNTERTALKEGMFLINKMKTKNKIRLGFILATSYLIFQLM